MPGVVAHEEKIYAFDGRNRFDDEIIREGLHSRRGIFCVPGVDIVELDVVRRPVVCPRLFVQPEHVTLVLSCGACGGHQEEDGWEAIPSMSVGQRYPGVIGSRDIILA